MTREMTSYPICASQKVCLRLPAATVSHQLVEGHVIFRIEETQYNAAINYRVPVEFTPARTTVVLCRLPLSFPFMTPPSIRIRTRKQLPKYRRPRESPE